MNKPLLSIVVANYNYGRFLEESLCSVLRQCVEWESIEKGVPVNSLTLPCGANLEVIICDAGSSDNSVSIIEKYAKLLGGVRFSEGALPAKEASLSWCSEKDRGQSNAFNKGFSLAKGRFLTWLNADDVMFPGVIEALQKAAEKYPMQEWFVGGSFWLDPEMRIWKCNQVRPFSSLRAKCGNVSVWGPSSFFSKRLLNEVGEIDERFHYMMDTELWCRFYNNGKTMYKPFVKYAFGLRLHPSGKMSGHNFKESSHADKNHPKWKQIMWEKNTIREKYQRIPMSFAVRLGSVSLFPYLFGLVDMFLNKGKHYLSYFKKEMS